MKIVAVVGSLDLKEKLGITPAYWQFLKGLYEAGHTLVVVPYVGKPVETLWWNTRKNPTYWESKIYRNFHKKIQMFKLRNRQKAIEQQDQKNKSSKKTTGNKLESNFVSRFLIKNVIRRKWKNHLMNIIEDEGDVDAVMFFMAPMNHLTGVPTKIKDEFDIPVAYYEGDMPIILPQFYDQSRLMSNYMKGADFSEYDAYFINSVEGIEYLEELGATNVHSLQYAADPSVYRKTDVDYEFDVFFYGHRTNAFREEWVENLLISPSKKTDYNFLLSCDQKYDGESFHHMPSMPFSKWRNYVSASKINLNITRRHHAKFNATSTLRPFELAAMESCIVSNPVNGIGDWFEIGDEIFVANSTEEAIELYDWLLDDEELRLKTAKKAKERVMKEHTYEHRANTIVDVLTNL